MNSQQLAEVLKSQQEAVSVRELKSRFSTLAASLTAQPVLVKSDGRLIAALVDIVEWQETSEKAAAYDRLVKESADGTK